MTPSIARSKSLSSTIMSNEIIFYDASIQGPVRPNKCYAPNTLYVYSQNNQTTIADAMAGYPVQFVTRSTTRSCPTRPCGSNTTRSSRLPRRSARSQQGLNLTGGFVSSNYPSWLGGMTS